MSVSVREEAGFLLLIGFNRAGNPLDILYNELDDGRILVFHAMPLGKEKQKRFTDCELKFDRLRHMATQIKRKFW